MKVMEVLQVNSPGIKKKLKKAVVDVQHCVACGCCVKECPRDAVTVVKGVTAAIDEALCVGCGKCSTICPASVVTIKEVAV